MGEILEIAIIGAGPGGIGAATNAARHGISHVLIEKAEVANTIYQYQLKKYVMAEPQHLPLRAECRFEAGSRETILEQFGEDLERHGVNVVKGEVTAIEREGELYRISYGDASCLARHIVMAIGVQGSPRKLGVSGDALPHVFYTLSDPEAHTGKDIVVVGAGDAAIENALALLERNTVTLINRGAEFARAKDANSRKILQAISSGEMRCFYNTTIESVKSDTIVLNTPEGEVSVPCNHIIARLGCVPPRKFLEGVGISFPSADINSVPVVSERYESNVPGIHIIGALIGYPLIKQAINQGYEVVEHIRGAPVLPADQPLVEERFSHIENGYENYFLRLQELLPHFQELSSPQIRELVIDSSVHEMRPVTTVFEKNDYTDTFWSVLSGSVHVVLDGGERTVTLSAGDVFGEMGLLSGRRRMATIKTGLSGAVLLETPRKQIVKLLASVEPFKVYIDRLFMERALGASVFAGASHEFLSDLVSKATLKTFKKGEMLFAEGDEGHEMFFIRKGSIKISRRNSKKVDIAQTYVPAGHIIGEMAVLQDNGIRSASATAAVPVEVVVIKKSDLDQLQERFPEALHAIEQVAEDRAIENTLADWSEESASLLDFMVQEGLTDAESVLLIDSNLCIGCDNCESACAATHGGYSRLDRKEGKSFASLQLPIACRHCENPLCMLDCPPDALTRQEDGEVVIRDSCIGCGNCVTNCPYGVIKLVHDAPESRWSLFDLFKKKQKDTGPAKAAKCDMCHDHKGGPACVRACPTGAAIRVNAEKLIQIAGTKHE